MAAGKAGWRGPGIRAQRGKGTPKSVRSLQGPRSCTLTEVIGHIHLPEAMFVYCILESERVFLQISGVSQKTGTQTFFLYS